MEYATLFGRTITEFCSLRYITGSHWELDIHDIFTKGTDYLHLLHLVDVIKRHCTYLQKCLLTLTASDFNQLISNPIQFAEFMRFRNQIVRYSLFFAFSVLVLCPDYFRLVASTILNHNRSLYLHLTRHVLTYGIASSITFHIIILAMCLRSLCIMRKTCIEMKENRATNKSKIRPLLFATKTFIVVIILSFIMELLSCQCTYSITMPESSCLNIYWISFGYEGLSGYVVMISLLVWFPRLRPTSRSEGAGKARTVCYLFFTFICIFIAVIAAVYIQGGIFS